jgi:hypothetical protein
VAQHPVQFDTAEPRTKADYQRITLALLGSCRVGLRCQKALAADVFFFGFAAITHGWHIANL